MEVVHIGNVRLDKKNKNIFEDGESNRKYIYKEHGNMMKIRWKDGD